MLKQSITAYQNNLYYAAGNIPKTKQIVMLYDGIVKFLKQAHDAILREDIQERYNCIVKAQDVLNGLQVCLDHDHGGEIADILFNYYLGLEIRLHKVQQDNDPALLLACIGHIEKMRSAWDEIDQKQQTEEALAESKSAPKDGEAPDDDASAPFRAEHLHLVQQAMMEGTAAGLSVSA